MKKVIFIAGVIAILFAFSSCSDFFNDLFPGDEVPVPGPVIVDSESVPADSPVIFYLIKNSPENNALLEYRPDKILDELKCAKISVSRAWYPASPVMCKAMNAVEALVIEMKSPDPRIYDYGFVDESGMWIVNCGVNEFYFYNYIVR